MPRFRVNWPRIISSVSIAIFVAVSVWAAVFFLEMHRELSALRTQEAANQKRLAEIQARLAVRQAYLERLQRDPALVEDIIRKKLGYVRAEEFVFRFEDNRTP